MIPVNPYESQQNTALQQGAAVRERLAKLAYHREMYNQQMMRKAEQQTAAEEKYLKDTQASDQKASMFELGGTLLGAGIGTIVAPGAGTVIGAGLGAAAGAGAASVFSSETRPKAPKSVAAVPQQNYAQHAGQGLLSSAQAYFMNQINGTSEGSTAPTSGSTEPTIARQTALQPQFDPMRVNPSRPVPDYIG